MTRRIAVQSLIAALLLVGCSDDFPDEFDAVPASAEVVASVDARSAYELLRQTAIAAAPDGVKDKAPALDAVLSQAMDIAGLDLRKLDHLLLFGDPDAPSRGVAIALGLAAHGLKGKPAGEHLGVPIFELVGFTYAVVPGLGVVLAPGKPALTECIDAWKGKAKRLVDTERGKVLARLLGVERDLDLVRIYALTDKLPGSGMLPMKIQGGALLFHAERGAAGVLVSDEKGAKELAVWARRGISSLQMLTAFGASDVLGPKSPIPVDKDTEQHVLKLISRVETRQDREKVVVLCRAEMKQLVAGAARAGLEQLQVEMQPDRPPPPIAPMPQSAPSSP
ncbi:MAG: hypothetical protein JXR96_26690 [Deltaproteobacteria bacterium]|nr:hypothetical protein [Deltaproteobacteria bacterium]